MRRKRKTVSRGKLSWLCFSGKVLPALVVINRLPWLITSYAKGILLGFSTIIWISMITAPGFEK